MEVGESVHLGVAIRKINGQPEGWRGSLHGQWRSLRRRLLGFPQTAPSASKVTAMRWDAAAAANAGAMCGD